MHASLWRNTSGNREKIVTLRRARGGPRGEEGRGQASGESLGVLVLVVPPRRRWGRPPASRRKPRWLGGPRTEGYVASRRRAAEVEGLGGGAHVSPRPGRARAATLIENQEGRRRACKSAERWGSCGPKRNRRNRERHGPHPRATIRAQSTRTEGARGANATRAQDHPRVWFGSRTLIVSTTTRSHADEGWLTRGCGSSPSRCGS